MNQPDEPEAIAGFVAESAAPAVSEPAVGAPEHSTQRTRSPAPARLRWLAVITVLVVVAAIAVVGLTISRGGLGGDVKAGGIGLGWRAVDDPDLAFDASWSLLGAVIPGGPGAITTAFGTGDPAAAGVYRLTAAGTWQALTSGLGQGGLFDMVDAGGTLVVVGNKAPPSIQCDPTQPQLDCPMSSEPQAWRSTDGGEHWEAVVVAGGEGAMEAAAALGDGTVVAVGRVLHTIASYDAKAWVSTPTPP